MEKQEVIIVGGGLAGLIAAIHLSQKGIPVLLFEKEKYPRHKVCGEYVSKEILPYFQELGISIEELNPVNIQRMVFSTANGKSIETELPLGGLGLSRNAFDYFLFRKAQELGVQIKKETVSSIVFSQEEFKVTTSEHSYISRFVLAAFGKRSLLDKALNRNFIQKSASWLAVKNHYAIDDFPEDLVALHNFQGGYCGLSKTETGVVNVCYLASYKSFKKYKNHKSFRREVLCKNPNLNSFFHTAVPVLHQPLSIAQVSFQPKDAVEGHLLFLGDAAGLLHPLCGNGMAMAIHSAKLASELLLDFYTTKYSTREVLEIRYAALWKRHFRKRMTTGRLLQKILLNEGLANASQNLITNWPGILPRIIKNTHGKPII